MIHLRNWQRRLRQFPGVLLGAIAIVVMIILTHVPFATPLLAQTKDQSAFKISQLETEVRRLQSQIRRLETQLDRFQRTSQNDAITPDSNNISPPTATDPAADLMFDQLATLVIETRQDMFALQDRVTTLESTRHNGNDSL